MDESVWTDATRQASRTYSAASDRFTAPALGFWDRYGTATVSRLGLMPGQRVLDLCCGAGASAIPAAHAVGPAGRVIGVDVAQPLLDRARARADAEGLTNLELRCADATATGFADHEYNAVVCVFGVFFLPDMVGFTAEMWRLVRPGGDLAITTWGPGWMEPASTVFWDAVRAVEPALYRSFNPWDTITTPAALLELFAAAGAEPAQAEPIAGSHELDHPDDFWDVVLGTGYRATVDALAPDQVERVKHEVLGQLRARDVTSLRADVVLGTARRP